MLEEITVQTIGNLEIYKLINHASKEVCYGWRDKHSPQGFEKFSSVYDALNHYRGLKSKFKKSGGQC